jgi:hypothetical protein
MERVARTSMGAASGGVLGLLASGLLGMGRQGGNTPVLWTVLLTVVFAAAMAWLNQRVSRPAEPAPPRAVLGVIFTSGALLLTLAVFLTQSVHIELLMGSGAKVDLPLSIWPVSRAALLVSVFATVVGVLVALIGWIESARGKSKAGNWVAMSLLAAGAWGGLAMAVYATGHGIVFGG